MSIDTTGAPPERLWFLGGLLKIRTRRATTDGVNAVVETHAPRGYQTPAHVHEREAETIYVLDGELSYRRGDETGTAGPGGLVHLPKHVPHRFAVTSDLAHFLVILTPAGFEDFFLRLGSPTATDRLPEPGEDGVDLAAMAALAPEFGVTLLGRCT